MTSPTPPIHHDPDGRRFYADLGDGLAYLAYRLPDARTIDLVSTFVPPQHRGRNLGTALVERALAFARERELRVVPTCGFVGRVMQGGGPAEPE